jgi:hypothetical protein
VDVCRWRSSCMAFDDQASLSAQACVADVQEEAGELEEVGAKVRGLHVGDDEDPVKVQAGSKVNAHASDAVYINACSRGRGELDIATVDAKVGPRRENADACAGVYSVGAAVGEVFNVDNAGRGRCPLERTLGPHCREPACPFFEQGSWHLRALSPNLWW